MLQMQGGVLAEKGHRVDLPLIFGALFIAHLLAIILYWVVALQCRGRLSYNYHVGTRD
jgi:hypothetical protein